MLISIEGIDFSGKTTFTKALHAALAKRFDAVSIGSNFYDQPNSEAWFKLFLDKEHPLTTWEQALLAAYAHERGIRLSLKPKLLEGEVVLMDRYIASFLAMQGFVDGPEAFTLVTELLSLMDYVRPSLLILLKLDEATFYERRARCVEERGRAPDVYEAKPWSYHRSIQEFYQDSAAGIIGAKRVHVLEAGFDLEKEVARLVEQIVTEQLQRLADLGVRL